jgi:hypothetical protein
MVSCWFVSICDQPLFHGAHVAEVKVGCPMRGRRRCAYMGLSRRKAAFAFVDLPTRW